LLSTADDYLRHKKYSEAPKLFEEAAKSANDVKSTIAFYRKAAEAYDDLGSYEEEARCLMITSTFLQGKEKIDCLIACWKTYIKAIAVYQYEASFEWKGEVENLDPSYGKTIEKYYSQSVNVLKKVFAIRKNDVDGLLDELRSECAIMSNEGGWAVSECASSINEAYEKGSLNK
jgi:hypothetical protein